MILFFRRKNISASTSMCLIVLKQPLERTNAPSCAVDMIGDIYTDVINLYSYF